MVTRKSMRIELDCGELQKSILISWPSHVCHSTVFSKGGLGRGRPPLSCYSVPRLCVDLGVSNVSRNGDRSCSATPDSYT